MEADLKEKQSTEEEIKRLKTEVEHWKKREKERKENEEGIEKILEHFEDPNNYITKEIKIAERYFWGFLVAAILFGAFFICRTLYLFFWDATTLSEISNGWQFLKIMSPSILSLSLMSYFFSSVFKRRQEIKELEEQRRQIKTIKSSLIAFNSFNEQEETKEELRDTIRKLRDAAMAGFKGRQEGVQVKQTEFDEDPQAIKNLINEAVKQAFKGMK